MRTSNILLLLIFSLFLFSCRTQRAVYNYLEDVNDTAFRKNVYITEARIQKNDLLSVVIYSASLDPKVDEYYNLPSQRSIGGGNTQASGYLVDVTGNIALPHIGPLHAEGLTKSELERLIIQKLAESGQLTEPSVIVRFLNF